VLIGPHRIERFRLFLDTGNNGWNQASNQTRQLGVDAPQRTSSTTISNAASSARKASPAAPSAPSWTPLPATVVPLLRQMQAAGKGGIGIKLFGAAPRAPTAAA